MDYLLIGMGVLSIPILAGMLVHSNSEWIKEHHFKIVALNMSILLSFTVVELVPLAVDFSHAGLIFVALGILIPLLFHHSGHKPYEDAQMHTSIKFLMIGACIHCFVDGIIMATGLFIDAHTGALTLSSMFLHKFTEIMMFSLILFPVVHHRSKLILYLLSLSIFTILGMGIATLFVNSFDTFGVFSGIALALTAGIFIFMSLTELSKVVECSKLRYAAIYPFVGCAIFFGLHFFMH